MGVTSSQAVSSGFFRVHLWVLMGLNTMAALDTKLLEDVSQLKSLTSEKLRNLGRLPYPMLRRNLVYTGVTRGKRLVVLVGEKRACAVAVYGTMTKPRHTKLREWGEMHPRDRPTLPHPYPAAVDVRRARRGRQDPRATRRLRR